jgi:uncharacterized protein (TIGR02453 family)
LQTDTGGFNGFFKETTDFFEKLKTNNNKKWFDLNRRIYEDYVLEPARSFIVATGERLRELSPAINADPHVNKSLFRINRDTRFSKDKSPYKTNLGIIFWDGDVPRMQSSVFYFHLESSSILLGAGIYKFTRPQLEEYRKSVMHPVYGEKLTDIFNSLTGKGYAFGEKNYKRIPKGYDAGHKNSEFLLYDGMHAGKSFGIPESFFSADFIDFCFESFREMLPVQKWLSDLTRRS